MKCHHATVVLLVLLLVSFYSSLTRPAVAAPIKRTVMVDGVARTALVEPGKDAATTPSPLVFAFHGLGGRASDMVGFRLAKAWPEATIVYPEGLKRVDPGGDGIFPGWQFLPGEYDDRDVRFVEALLKDLTGAYIVDERRIYTTGFSNGATFSYVLLTVQPERFAAIAAVASFGPPSLKWARVPRPVLIVEGKKDSPVDTEWGRDRLRRLNGCSAESIAWSPGALLYGPCTSGQPLIWSLHNGGHEWPAGTAATIVRFFQEHALPAAPPPAPAAPEPNPQGTVAGTGKAGFSGDGGPAATAQLYFPEGVAAGIADNLLIVDTGNHRIRQVIPDGTIRTVAGSSVSGLNNTTRATSAQLFFPGAIAADRAGSFYFADSLNLRVHKVTPDGAISTVAGREPPEDTRLGASGDGGPATQAQLGLPLGLAVDAAGVLYIADTFNHRVRRVGPDGTITTVAGTGLPGFSGDGGPATAAQLDEPWGLAVDAAGSLLIADAGNHRVRRLHPDGTITTVAGSGTAGFSGDGGPAAAAQLNQPSGVAVDSQGAIFIVDSLNRRVRQVGPDGTITTVVGAGAPGAALSLANPAGLAIDRAGNLFIADPFAHRVWQAPGIAAPGLIAGQAFP